MKRDYDSGVSDQVKLFTGIEIEHTPAHNLKTLFVVGLQPIDQLVSAVKENQVQHIYFGANQSFDGSDVAVWEDVIRAVHKKTEALVKFITLDFDVQHAAKILETRLHEHVWFIPQISVKIPYIEMFNYNTTVKIDDIDFNKTNPGVWCHKLTTLLDEKKYTTWHQYGKDKPL